LISSPNLSYGTPKFANFETFQSLSRNISPIVKQTSENSSYFYFRFSRNRLFLRHISSFFVIFATIFLEMYPTDLREIFSVCRLSAYGSTYKKLPR